MIYSSKLNPKGQNVFDKSGLSQDAIPWVQILHPVSSDEYENPQEVWCVLAHDLYEHFARKRYRNDGWLLYSRC